MTSPSTRFFAHPKPIKPTVFATDLSPSATDTSVPDTIAYSLHLIACSASLIDGHHAVRIFGEQERVEVTIRKRTYKA
jgi:hypothetical protein